MVGKFFTPNFTTTPSRDDKKQYLWYHLNVNNAKKEK